MIDRVKESPFIAPRALWWLMFTLARSSFRSVFRRSFSLSGLYVVFVAFLLIFLFLGDRVGVPPFLGTIFFLFGPFALAVLTLFGIRVGLSSNPFSFNMAETTFLLTAPFSQAKLLGYKVSQFFVMALSVSLLSAFAITKPDRFAEASLKFFLVLSFLQLLPVSTATLFPRKDSKTSRTLKLLLDLLIGALVLSLSASIYFRFVGREDISKIFSKALFEMTQPFIFTDNFLYPKNRADHMAAILRFLVPDLGLAAIFLLGYRRLELDSVFYKSLYEPARRISRFQGVGIGASRFFIELPISWFPQLGGLGPILWRKGQEYLRNFWSLVLIATLLALTYVGFSLFMIRVFPPTEELYGLRLWHLHCAARIFPLIAMVFSSFCDFRADSAYLPTLLTWPVSARKMVLGQLLISTFHLFLLICLLSLVGAFIYKTNTPYNVGTFIFFSILTAPFAAFLIAAADNLLFLLLPVPDTKLTGRTLGKLLFQFMLLFAVNGLLARLFFLADERAALLARGSEYKHWWFFGGTSALYFILGLSFFLTATWIFKRGISTRGV